MLTPLALIARRWTPSPRTLRRAALSAVVMSVLIIVTGGAVRLTGSGLGCRERRRTDARGVREVLP
ncbi:hypothetical protein ABZ054_22550, partial [Streptomyces sp. NPDC006324]